MLTTAALRIAIGTAEAADATGTVVPNLVVGTLAVVVGVLITANRERLFHSISKGQELVVRKNGADLLRRMQSAWWVGFAGVWCVLLGVAMWTFAAVDIARGI